MTAPDPDDPLVCINTRAAGGPPTCEPNLGHCEGCEMCKHACTCHKPTPLDNETLNAALDAYAVHQGAINWHALTDVIPTYTADEYQAGVAAAVAPLQARIHRLTAEVENLKHSKETSC